LLKKWGDRVQVLVAKRGLDVKELDGEVDEVAGKLAETTLYRALLS